MIVGYHELGCKFQEGEHASIEHQAEQCNAPEPGVGEYKLQIGEVEPFVVSVVLRLGIYSSGRSVELFVHHGVDNKRQKPHDEQHGTQQDGDTHAVAKGACHGQGEAHGCKSAQTG